MEKIQRITSVCHNGINIMWFPFSFNFSEETITLVESSSEIHEFMELIRLMFRTDNHRTGTVDKLRFRDRLFRAKIGGAPTQCTIQFSTAEAEYTLHKRFVDLYSVEVKLQKTGSSVIYYGQEALSIIDKFVKPIALDSNLTRRVNSCILKPDSNFSKSNMIRLSSNWAKKLGIGQPIADLSYDGIWYPRYNKMAPNFVVEEFLANSQINLLANLAQAVERKRKFGYCMPVMYYFRTGDAELAQFIETIALVSEVCKNENIQFLIFLKQTKPVDEQILENNELDIIQTPCLSIYQSI